MLKITDQISKAGNIRNEDIYAYSENTLLLLDGSSGLVPNAPDAQYFVTEYSRIFMEKIAKVKDLCWSVNYSLLELSKLYDREIAQDFAVLPSASLMAVQQKDGKLRFLSVGDCTALIKTKDQLFTLYCNQVEGFDNAVKAQALKVREQTGEDICNIMQTPSIKQMLFNNRLKMNAPDGYEILAFNMAPRNESHIIEFDVSEIEEVVVFTDGFDSMSHELAKIPCPPLSDVYEKLREQEKTDSTFNKFPRFKLSDDATAVVFKVE